MSSRNTYLSPSERAAAPVLYGALRHARELHERGERDADVLRIAIREILRSETLVVVEYVSIADPQTLEEMDHVDSSAMASLAVRIGPVRLLDNILLCSPT
jgi:pantoate--beta-alanine ligase